MDVFVQGGQYLNLDKDTQLNLRVQKLSPLGRGPCARYGHAATLFQNNLMVIYGGKNDQLALQGMSPVLNDIHIYDISKR